MLLVSLITLLVICSGIAILFFILYARARMQEDEAKEKLYLKIHYAALFIIFLAGIVYMFFMVENSD